MDRFTDLVGMQFGSLTVLSFVESRGKEGRFWLCRCECGTERVFRGNALTKKYKSTKSCGCKRVESLKKRFIDLVGNKYGLLTVIKYTETKRGHTYWECKCECGNTKDISSQSLKKGLTKSCGCRQGKGNYKHGLSGTYAHKLFLFKDPARKLRHNVGISVNDSLRAKGGSKKGKSIFAFLPYTFDEFKKHLESQWEDWMNWDNYGGKPNDKRKTWWIDHIKPHSSFNYTSLDDPKFLECWTLSNIRPLEKILNIKKNNR